LLTGEVVNRYLLEKGKGKLLKKRIKILTVNTIANFFLPLEKDPKQENQTNPQHARNEIYTPYRILKRERTPGSGYTIKIS